MPRHEQIIIFLNEREKQTLLKNCGEFGMNRTEYLRLLILYGEQINNWMKKTLYEQGKQVVLKRGKNDTN